MKVRNQAPRQTPPGTPMKCPSQKVLSSLQHLCMLRRLISILSNTNPQPRTLTHLASMASTSSSSATPNILAPAVDKTAHEFSKADFDSLLSRRFFFAPAFEIYGGESRLLSNSAPSWVWLKVRG